MFRSVSSTITKLALVFLLVPVLGFAQTEGGRSYVYNNIKVVMTVNTDTTVDVSEYLTYHFTGTYHQGWRSIPFNKISDISEVVVYDEAGKSLKYSASSLNKTDPSSWGYYTYKKNNGSLEVEWYYDATDEVRTWRIDYKVHGGIGFLSDRDEWYWNLFTDYDVPVLATQATVILPTGITPKQILGTEVYTDSASSSKELLVNSFGQTEAQFIVDYTPAFENVTIAVGWPKGVVDKGAFWRWWWWQNWGYVGSVLVVLLSIIGLILYWLKTEYFYPNKRTIIAEYEPPLNLRPAEVDVILHERVSPLAWPATVVDLAVKGYIKIEASLPNGILFKISRQGSLFLLAVFTFISLLCFYFFSYNVLGIFFTVFFSLLAVSHFLGYFMTKKVLNSRTSYIIKRAKDDDDQLREYEKIFLDTILDDNGVWNSKELKNKPGQARKIYLGIEKLKQFLVMKIEEVGNFYEKSLSKEKGKTKILAYLFIGVWVLFWLGGLLSGLIEFIFSNLFKNINLFPVTLFIITTVFMSVLWYAFVKYEARLSAKGNKVKEDLLGFKLYLKTAERYRLQNLTPDLFEKYLPYAMVFGVEEEWGKAFIDMAMPEPDWYHSTNRSRGFSGSPATSNGNSFSASILSASFASSFSSAFSSSGGFRSGGSSSGSGGGGSSGGGGGGGGGGAS